MLAGNAYNLQTHIHNVDDDRTMSMSLSIIEGKLGHQNIDIKWLIN